RLRQGRLRLRRSRPPGTGPWHAAPWNLSWGILRRLRHVVALEARAWGEGHSTTRRWGRIFQRAVWGRFVAAFGRWEKALPFPNSLSAGHLAKGRLQERETLCNGRENRDASRSKNRCKLLSEKTIDRLRRIRLESAFWPSARCPDAISPTLAVATACAMAWQHTRQAEPTATSK